MKRYGSAVCIAAATLAVLGFAGPVAAQTQVPLKGSLSGVDIGMPIPNTPLASVTVNATGNATHFGKFTFIQMVTVNTGTGVANGTFVLTAANGDTVVGTVSGKATFAPPNFLNIVEAAIITGGTGRFAGSTGSFTVIRVKNTITGATTAIFTGMISGPGKGN